MNILFIGGTSFIGPHVVRSLHEAGHHIICFHRGKSKADLPAEVEHIYGDRREISQFRSELRQQKPEIVIDMIPLTQGDIEVELDIFADISERLIVISSQDVYRAYGIMNNSEEGPLQSTPIDEDSELRTKLYPYRDLGYNLDDYDKILVEQTAMAADSIATTVLRLPMVYGPGDRQYRLFPYLKRMDDQRPYILISQSMSKWRWSHGYVENVADAIVLSVLNGSARNKIYNVAEPFFLSREEWIKKIAQQAGWSGELYIAPDDEFPERYQDTSNTAQDLVVDSTKIRQELGFQEQHSLEAALDKTIEWERSNPPIRYDESQFDYRDEDTVVADLEKKGVLKKYIDREK